MLELNLVICHKHYFVVFMFSKWCTFLSDVIWFDFQILKWDVKLLALVFLLSCGKRGDWVSTLWCIHESSQTFMITPKISKKKCVSSNISRTTIKITKLIYLPCLHQKSRNIQTYHFNQFLSWEGRLYFVPTVE